MANFYSLLMFYEEFWYGYHGGAFCGLSIKCKLQKIFHDNFVISPIFYESITNQFKTGDGPFTNGLKRETKLCVRVCLKMFKLE